MTSSNYFNNQTHTAFKQREVQREQSSEQSKIDGAELLCNY